MQPTPWGAEYRQSVQSKRLQVRKKFTGAVTALSLGELDNDI